MLDDATVDTNVFLHAANEIEIRCAASKTFLQGLLAGKTVLCVDEGFDIVESRNRSAIGGEYHNQLRWVHTAFQIIAALGRQGRLQVIPRSVDAATARKINRLVCDKTDRIFLKVSYNSRSQTLVSHDFCDISVAKRNEIRRQVGVRTVDAEIAHQLNQGGCPGEIP